MALGVSLAAHRKHKLTMLSLLLLCVPLMIKAQCNVGNTIYIMGDMYQVIEGGGYYNDRSVCSNPNNIPYCAFQSGCLDGSSISISGIPLNCDETTGNCAITTNTAICTTTTYCGSRALVVDGKPRISVTSTLAGVTIGIAYNMGRYTIQYSAPGATQCVNYTTGATIPCNRYVIVHDTIPPTVYLNGSAVIHLQGGFQYKEAGAYAVDIVDGTMPFVANLTCPYDIATGYITGVQLEVCHINPASPNSAMLDSYVLGNQTIYYVAVDRSQNRGFTTREIVLKDTIPPVLSLNGCSQNDAVCPMQWEGATRFEDPGAIAIDLVDGNVSVYRSVSVDTVYKGQYYVTYNAHDKSFNWSPTRHRLVTVVETTPPLIVLLGNSSMFVQGATPYIEPFAYAYDNVDGEITNLITMTIIRRSHLPGTPSCTKSTGCTNSI